MLILLSVGAGLLAGFIVLSLSLSASWRVVVPTNEVHIVQRGKTSISYGSGQPAGNVYWKFPHWLPSLGTSVNVMPVSIFQIQLMGYDAYDQEKVPFSVDVISFFHVEDPVEASKRVSAETTLDSQLQNMLKGAVRKVLASKDINTIMETRSELNATFLSEVSNQVKAWGVKVLSIEFIDIHDATGTHVITDIMNRKKSNIEKLSRIEVAENMRDAQLKEIDAKQIAEVRAVEAQQAIEMRNTERQRQVGIAQQQAAQVVKEEEQKTKTKEMAVARAGTVGQAEYEREQQVIKADAAAQAQKLQAEGYKNAQLLKAEGDSALVDKVGKAEADVIKAKAIAAAEGQLKQAEALAKIQAEGLQAQLGEKAIIAYQAIGVAMAAAYEKADIKAILTEGGGIESLGELLTAPGGAKVASFIDAMKKTVGGDNILKSLGMDSLVPKSTK